MPRKVKVNESVKHETGDTSHPDKVSGDMSDVGEDDVGEDEDEDDDAGDDAGEEVAGDDAGEEVAGDDDIVAEDEDGEDDDGEDADGEDVDATGDGEPADDVDDVPDMKSSAKSKGKVNTIPNTTLISKQIRSCVGCSQVDDTPDIIDIQPNLSRSRVGIELIGVDRISYPYLTKYEEIRILCVRTKQLSLGAKKMLKIEKEYANRLSALDIAREELRLGTTPFKIKRTHPSGNYEVWAVDEFTA